MIEFIDVTKTYSTGKGVFNLNFVLDKGITAFLGKNGAGKTTTINLLMGFLQPASGSILIDGYNLWEMDNLNRAKQNTGFIPNEDYFFDYLTGRENLEYLGILKKNNKNAYESLKNYMDLFDISSFIDDAFCTYSTGMKKKIQLIGALIGDPNVLIFDEPNNGLDIISNIHLTELLDELKRNGKTVFLSSHILEVVQTVADSILIIHDGKIEKEIVRPFEDLSSQYLSVAEKNKK